MAVNGNYLQTPQAMLDLQLGGPPATHRFGQLSVDGSAALQDCKLNRNVGLGGAIARDDDSRRVSDVASGRCGSDDISGWRHLHERHLLGLVRSLRQVQSVDAAGVATLQLTLLGLRMEMGRDGTIPIVFDSQKVDPANAALNKELLQYIGKQL